MKPQKFVLSALLLAGLSLGGCGVFSSSSDSGSGSPTNTAVAQTTPLEYQAYADVLATYVDEQGLVNYSALQADRQLLDQSVQALGAIPQTTYTQWPDAEKIAFLINAYNALTLQSIIDQSPIKQSIRDIPGVWKWRKHKVAGQSLTLDHIEHEILRKAFNEPRIHMALVCAANSCPPLRREPYTGDRLETQLVDQTERFLRHPQGFALDSDNQSVKLSKIFQWFGEDWVKSYQVESGYQGNNKEKAVLNFIGMYLSPSEQAFLQSDKYKIQYFNYDWSLNRQS